MQLPISITPTAPSSVGEPTGQIGVSVFTFPENCSVLFCETCGNALVAGLNRKAVPVLAHGSFFKSIFTVSVLTVPWSLRGQAVESIKAALNELHLEHRATVATKTADDSWLSIHGFDLGGTSFDKGFLLPEDIAACRENYEKYQKDAALAYHILIETLKTSAALKADKPEAT